MFIKQNIYKTASPDRYEILRNNARSNRLEPTVGELALWSIVRGKQLGYRFRRQHPIFDYIVDFVCLEKKLVVEVDGKYHFTDEQHHEDEIRTHALQQLGYTILRFTNEEVQFNQEHVAHTIKEKLNNRQI